MKITILIITWIFSFFPNLKAKESYNWWLTRRILYGCEITLLLRNDFAAILHSAVEFLLKFPDICDTLEAEHRKLKARFAALRNHPFAAK